VRRDEKKIRFWGVIAVIFVIIAEKMTFRRVWHGIRIGREEGERERGSCTGLYSKGRDA
jgi:hypothetical protein